MVQKDKFQLDNSFHKSILALLIIFTVPLPARSEIKIPTRKDCSLMAKSNKGGYDGKGNKKIKTKESYRLFSI